MDLALAGALSGAGNAGTQALQQFGNFAGQSFLNQEKDRLENDRIKLQEQYAKDRQQAWFAHDTGLLTTRETGETARQATALTSHSADIATQTKSDEGIHAGELASKETLANAELKMKGPYYDAMAKYYLAREPTAGKKAGTGESPADKKQKEFLESVSAKRLEGLHKLLEIAPPDEKADIQEQIDQVVREARSVAGLSAPEAPAPGQIKDRFANPAVTGGK
jgi:hypothetical protein